MTTPDHAAQHSYTEARTGTHVAVYDGLEAGMDTAAGRWQTVCEQHAHSISHLTLADARALAAHPEQWCEERMAELEGQQTLTPEAKLSLDWEDHPQ